MANVLLTAKSSADRTQVVELRADSGGGLIAVTNSHAKIHLGDFYGAGYYNASIADAASIQLLVQVPSTVDLHTAIKVKCGGDCTFQMYDSVTFSAVGTAITPQNHNRCYPNASLATVTHTPTTTGNSIIWQEYFPGGHGGVSPGAVSDSGEQTVLCHGNNYLLEITNISGAPKPVDLVISYYEVAV